MDLNLNKVTVLIAVYKGDNFQHFSQSISSLINQKIYIHEVLLIINGSVPNELLNIIKKLSLSLPIRSIQYKENYGLAKALNLTLPLVESDWIVRLDSDDICDKNRFFNINKIINKYGNEFDVFGTYIQEFNNKINDIKTIRKVPLSCNSIKLFSIFSSPMNHVTTFYKKKITANNPNFYPLIDGFEDYALWLRLIKQKIKIKNIPIISVYVRTGNNMIKRRGGIEYVKNEIKFRISSSKYIDNLLILPYFIASIIRIIIFLSPKFFKKYLYFLKRKYF